MPIITKYAVQPFPPKLHEWQGFPVGSGLEESVCGASAPGLRVFPCSQLWAGCDRVLAFVGTVPVMVSCKQ